MIRQLRFQIVNLCILPYSRIIHLRAVCLSVDIVQSCMGVETGRIYQWRGRGYASRTHRQPRLAGLLRLKRGDGETGLDGSELR